MSRGDMYRTYVNKLMHCTLQRKKKVFSQERAADLQWAARTDRNKWINLYFPPILAIAGRISPLFSHARFGHAMYDLITTGQRKEER
jgi:hypothetical protein